MNTQSNEQSPQVLNDNVDIQMILKNTEDVIDSLNVNYLENLITKILEKDLQFGKTQCLKIQKNIDSMKKDIENSTNSVIEDEEQTLSNLSQGLVELKESLNLSQSSEQKIHVILSIFTIIIKVIEQWLLQKKKQSKEIDHLISETQDLINSITAIPSQT